MLNRPVPKFPDPIRDIIDYMNDSLDAHVATDLKGWHAPTLWVTVQPTGGIIVNSYRVFRPVYDVNIYGPTKPEAMNLALEAMQAMYFMKNEVLESGAVCTEVSCSWPADIQDPINSNPRYVFDANLTFRTP
jgi:hypothetical protein